MIENLPAFILLTFGLTTLAALFLFYLALKNANSAGIKKIANKILLFLSFWLIIQAILTLKEIYKSDTNSTPPKILLFGIFPTILTIIILFITRPGRQFIESLPLKEITYLNVIRIPVELVLIMLYMHHAIPRLMTFEGRNFDILAGLSAPFIAYYGLTKKKLGMLTILVWNFISLGLLLNIVVNALLSAPSVFQKFAFDQPNIAIINFPFSWLPTFIVPIILFGHLASIRIILKAGHTDDPPPAII
jgi:hypothetical protein